MRRERPEDEQYGGLRGSTGPPSLLFDLLFRVVHGRQFVHLRLETLDSVRDALDGLLQTEDG